MRGKGTGQDPESRRGKAGGNRRVIIPVIILAIAGIGIYFGLAERAAEDDLPIRAAWIEPQVGGDVVSFPVSEVENNRNIHFLVETQSRAMHFMAYVWNGKIYIRANVCPPCLGIGYSLRRGILVCDMCATTFEAATGDGIRGACVDYPKAAVPYEIIDGSIVTKKADLVVAYENTLEPGWP